MASNDRVLSLYQLIKDINGHKARFIRYLFFVCKLFLSNKIDIESKNVPKKYLSKLTLLEKNIFRLNKILEIIKKSKTVSIAWQNKRNDKAVLQNLKYAKK